MTGEETPQEVQDSHPMAHVAPWYFSVPMLGFYTAIIGAVVVPIVSARCRVWCAQRMAQCGLEKHGKHLEQMKMPWERRVK